MTVGARADQALSACDRALVRGVAGSGKSSLLRWMAVQAACSQSASIEVPTGVVPFLVELNRFPDGQVPEPAQLIGGSLGAMMPDGWVTRMLDTGRALLLHDGLDEVPPRARQGVENYVSELSGTYPHVRYVVTTRPSAVAGIRGTARRRPAPRPGDTNLQRSRARGADRGRDRRQVGPAGSGREDSPIHHNPVRGGTDPAHRGMGSVRRLRELRSHRRWPAQCRLT